MIIVESLKDAIFATMSTTAPKPRSTAEAPPAPSRGRGRPVGDRDAQRTKLLNAAIAVIAQDGFAEASLRRVAERAGYSTGAVTYYFANREEMMAAVIESQFDKFDAMLAASNRGDKVDIRDALKRWLDSFSSSVEGEWVAIFQLLSMARNEPALAAVCQQRYARYRTVFTAMIAKGQRQGTIRKDIPAEFLADQINAMGDGWMMFFPIEPERFRPARVKAL